MMFSIKQKDINDKLQNICGVVDPKLTSDQTDKILDCIYFEVSPRQIKLTASSTDIQVSSTILGEFNETATFSVNARSLAEIVRTLPSIMDINFKVEENIISINSGKSRFTLPNFSTPSTPYPILNIKKTENLFNFSAKKLQSALESVSFSMGTHHLRYFLSGCMIRASEGKVVFVSTDTHRLSFYHLEESSINNMNRSMILPKKALMYIDKLLGLELNDVQVSYGEGDFFVVNSDQYYIQSKLIVGAYPEYERVFSQEMKYFAICDTQTLRESLQRVAVLANDKFKTIRFNLEKNQLIIESKSIVNETAITEMDLQYEGEEISFNFNVGYFTDLLSRFDEKKCRLSFIDDRSSVVVTFEGNDHFKYVLMPLRV